MKTIFIRLLRRIFLFSSLLIVSTFPQNTFIKTYPGIAAVGHSIIQTADSGFVIFGRTSKNQAVLLKVDRNGDTSWTQHYGNENEYPTFSYKIKQALDGGYFLGYGNTIIKIENNGAIVWTYNLNVGDIHDIEVTPDSCVNISGTMYQMMGDTLYYFYLSKFRNDGHLLWLSDYLPPELSVPLVKDIQITGDDGFIILVDLLFSRKYSYVIKTDTNGDTIWSRKYEGGYRSESYSVVETTDSNYFIAALFFEKPCEFCELFAHTWLLKLDQNGDSIWTRKHVFDIEDRSRAGKQTKDGGYIITGCKYTIEITKHLFVAKLDEFGDTVWTKTLIDDNFDSSEGYDIVETFDGGYAVTGSVSYENGQRDMLLLKLDKDGNITSVNDNKSNSLPKEFSLQQNYPNPFNPATKIQFSIAKDGQYTIKVFNILGQEVETLFDEYLNSGVYDVEFNAGTLPSGVYIYQLSGNKIILSKKLMLMR